MKVLVSDNMSEKGIDLFKKAKGITVDVKTGLPPEELKAIIKDYDGLAIRSATKVTAEIIGAAKKLKVIGRAGIGLDNVDIPAASQRGIVVMNTPEGNTITTAEHTISLILAMTRMIPQATASLKAQKWEKKKFQGREIFNKTLGIIGIGKIGSIVADRAKGLKMNVIAFDPFIQSETISKKGVEGVTPGRTLPAGRLYHPPRAQDQGYPGIHQCPGSGQNEKRGHAGQLLPGRGGGRAGPG